MVPPHATKPSIATITQTTRQGNRQPMKQTIDEAHEAEEHDDTDSMDVDDEVNEGEPEESQDTSEGLDQIMAKIVNDQRTRHKVNKQAVRKSYNVAYTTLQSSIDALFDEHEEEAASAHQAHVKRLKHLLKEKARIEAAMAIKLKELQAGYNAHSRDLEMVMNRRIKEMDGY